MNKFPKEVRMRLKRLEQPRLTLGDYGPWQVVDASRGMAQLPGQTAEVYEWGYATGPQWEPAFKTLVKDGRNWMSTNRLERESHAMHLLAARGDCVVLGAGMGLMVYNLIKKPEVDTVVAVDIDPDVLDLVEENAERHAWPGRQKVKYMCGDAKDVQRPDLEGLKGAPTHVYVDIWPTLMHANTISDVITIAGNLMPRMFGFWGQEIAFIQWAREVAHVVPVDLDTLTLDHFDSWCLHMDMVLQHRSVDYLRYCLVVYINQLAKKQAEKEQQHG